MLNDMHISEGEGTGHSYSTSFVNLSVLIDVTDRSALDPCLVSDMVGDLIPFPKSDS